MSCEWIFYPRVDSSDNDYGRVDASKVPEILKDPPVNIIAINSLGFMKSRVVFPLQESHYFGINDGIYIRKLPLSEGSLVDLELFEACKLEEICKPFPENESLSLPYVTE